MVVSKTRNANRIIKADESDLWRVSDTNYSFVLFWDRTQEISRCVEIARKAFHKMKKILCSSKLNIIIRT